MCTIFSITCIFKTQNGVSPTVNHNLVKTKNITGRQSIIKMIFENAITALISSQLQPHIYLKNMDFLLKKIPTFGTSLAKELTKNWQIPA